jgi:hypothetical protein
MRVFPTNKDFVKEVKDITQQNLGVVDTDGQDYSQESNSETWSAISNSAQLRGLSLQNGHRHGDFRLISDWAG